MFKPVKETKYRKPNPTKISNNIGVKANSSNLGLLSTYPKMRIGSQTVFTSCTVKSKIETWWGHQAARTEMQERHRDHQTSKVKIGEKKVQNCPDCPNSMTRQQHNQTMTVWGIKSALKIKYFRLGVTRNKLQKPSKPLLCLHLMIQNDVSCELHFHCTFSSKLINGKDKFTQVDDEVFSLLLQLFWNRPSPHQQDALLVFGNEWIQQLMMSHKVEVRLEGDLPHFDATSNPMVYM